MDTTSFQKYGGGCRVLPGSLPARLHKPPATYAGRRPDHRPAPFLYFSFPDPGYFLRLVLRAVPDLLLDLTVWPNLRTCASSAAWPNAFLTNASRLFSDNGIVGTGFTGTARYPLALRLSYTSFNLSPFGAVMYLGISFHPFKSELYFNSAFSGRLPVHRHRPPAKYAGRCPDHLPAPSLLSAAFKWPEPVCLVYHVFICIQLQPFRQTLLHCPAASPRVRVWPVLRASAVQPVARPASFPRNFEYVNTLLHHFLRWARSAHLLHCAQASAASYPAS